MGRRTANLWPSVLRPRPTWRAAARPAQRAWQISSKDQSSSFPARPGTGASRPREFLSDGRSRMRRQKRQGAAQPPDCPDDLLIQKVTTRDWRCPKKTEPRRGGMAAGCKKGRPQGLRAGDGRPAEQDSSADILWEPNSPCPCRKL